MGIYGNNEQNVADGTRRLVVPPPGYKFNQNDLEGAEAVAVALLCHEGQFRECVRLKIKIHNFLCIKIFPDLFHEWITQADIDSLTPAKLHAHPKYKEIVGKCKKSKVEYDLAKRTVHGSNYSMGWRTFQDTVLKETGGKTVIDAATAKRLLGSYMELFPEIKTYQMLIEEHVKLHDQIFNLFGHGVRFIQRFTTALARLGISWGPQSTVGICTILGAIRHQSQIEAERRDWHLHNIVHDSCLQSIPEAEEELGSLALANNMSIELTSPIDGWKFRIGVERQLGYNWGKYDEEENPKGLKAV